MGVTVDQWRAAIGFFCGGGLCSKAVFKEPNLSFSLSLLLVCIKFSVLISLLVIGGVELNPGPTYHCRHCTFSAESVGKYVSHQAIHSLMRHVVYYCPLCEYKTGVSRNLEGHIRRSHPTKELTPRTEQLTCISEEAKCAVPGCGACLETVDLLLSHLKGHIKNGDTVSCPLGRCTDPNRPKTWVTDFTKERIFSSHLSRCHKSRKLSANQLSSAPACALSSGAGSTNAPNFSEEITPEPLVENQPESTQDQPNEPQRA